MEVEMDLMKMKFDEVKILDLSAQTEPEVPDVVYEMTNLESIVLPKGCNIQVSERYKLLDSLPSIRTIDEQDVTQVRNGICNLNAIFVRRLQEMFLTKAASEIYYEQSSESSRIEKMVQLAKMTISAGPEVLKDFKDYKIEKLIRENYDVYVSEALEVAVKIKEEKENKGPPAKKRKTAASSKAKMKTKHLTASVSKLSLDNASNLKLEYLLRTHSRNNDPKDTQTKVWMCEFQPDIDDPLKTTNIVATCGGDSICLLDCHTGQVLKKYKQPNEVFYCISWTIMTCKNELTGEEHKKCMLAAGGLLGNIKLIDPTQLICYSSVCQHKKPIDSLMFHPTIGHWMFSGSEDQTIVLWDFNKPFSEEKSTAKKLVTFKSNTSGFVRHVAIFPHGKIVLGACDDGLFAWEVEPTTVAVRNPIYKFKFKGKNTPLDSAMCLSDNMIATKRVQEGCIKLFHSVSEFTKDDANIIYSLIWRNTETPFLKFNYCRGNYVLVAGDDEGVVWIYELNELVHAAKKSKVIKLNHDIIPKKLRCDNEQAKMFNHVSCSSNFQYVIAVSDTNLVAVWKTQWKNADGS